MGLRATGLTLGLDTATEDTAVAVFRGDEAVFDEVEAPRDGRPLHGPSLLPMIDRAVQRAGGWGALGRIAVGTGPGSFTGLRVGIATARALGRSAGVEVVGVPTLDALAAGALGSARPGRVVSAIDARRGQLFLGLYEQAGQESGQPWSNRLLEPQVCDPEGLAACLGLDAADPPTVAVGSGALRFRDQFEAAGVVVPDSADPSHTVSGRWIALIGGLTEEPVEPIYLRAPDAQQWLERAKTEKQGS